MTEYVTDTQALFWYLTESQNLGPQAAKAFDDAENGKALIYVSAMVLAELFYVNERNTKPIHFAQSYTALSEIANVVFCDVTPKDILEFEKDQPISEMHDRIVVGLARRTGAILLTNNDAIVSSKIVPTAW
jgi:PIN domain nuclease of toxin-antitoxin system